MFAIVYYIIYIASITCTANTVGEVFFSLIIRSLDTFCIILNVIIFSFFFDNLAYYFKFIGRGLTLQFLLNKSKRQKRESVRDLVQVSSSPASCNYYRVIIREKLIHNLLHNLLR